MVLKAAPPASPADAEQRLALVEELRPLAARINAGDLSVISIGDRCVTSGVLEALELKTKAFPFDWLFSSLAMVAHCLRDDFAEFLNPGQYEPVPLEQRSKPTVHRTHHRLYRDTFGVEHVFNHHDMPRSLPHFERAVGRFRVAPNPHLVHITGRRDPDIVAQVEAVAQAAESKVLAVCITHDATTVAAEIRHFAGGEDYDVFEMATEAPLQALGFSNARDEEAFARLLRESVDQA